MRFWVLAAVLLAVWAIVLVDWAEGHHCRDRCTVLKPQYRGCKVLYPSRRPARLFCEIRRAARHYGQSESAMRAVAYCESTYRWWINGHHEGAFQFSWSTWNGNQWRQPPYRHRSPYHPRWASLQTAWFWAHGYRGEWAC